MACSKMVLFCKELPTDTRVRKPLTPYSIDLEQIFHLINSVCFNGAIQNWKICWDNARITDYVGFVDYDYQCVVISPRVCEHMKYEDIVDAILHQMIHIHLWLQNPDVECIIHDPVFKSLEQRVILAWEDIDLPLLR